MEEPSRPFKEKSKYHTTNRQAIYILTPVVKDESKIREKTQEDTNVMVFLTWKASL